MTYAVGGTIAAADLNSALVILNPVWSTGTTNSGYGQTATATVAVGATVTVGPWANLISNTSSAALHQGSSITAVAIPVVGGIVTYTAAIPVNLNTIVNNRLNAASQSGTTSNTATYGTTWLNAITATHTITFASGDAARYFFNAGGQLAITCSHPTGSGINLLMNNLAANVGTIAMSSPVSGSVSIVGTSYSGITKIGGGGNAPSIGTNIGYYALTTVDQQIYNQTASTGPAGYLATLVNMKVRSNGTQGVNGDTGSIITITTLWDEIPNGLTVSAGTATTVTIRNPEVTNLSNSWGTPTVSGTVSGS